MKDPKIVYLLSALALCLMVLLGYSARAEFVRGNNDFAPLYAGSALWHSGDLYSNEQLLEKIFERTGMGDPTNGYIRPPFVAVLMSPFGALPFETALRAWQAASLAALVAFVWIWNPLNRPLTALLMCASVPALKALLNGQEVTFVLLIAALAARLKLSGRDATAGLVFALCAAKVHLFLLTPVWIVARKEWAFLKGLLLGGAALTVVFTAAAGWHWPIEMFRETQNPALSPNPAIMTNLHAATDALPISWAVEAALSLAVVGAVWMISKRRPSQESYAAALLGGLLLARHSYLADLLIVLPACLVLLASNSPRLLKAAAVVLAAPPATMLVSLGAPYSAALVLALWVLLVYWAAQAGKAEPTLEGAPA